MVDSKDGASRRTDESAVFRILESGLDELEIGEPAAQAAQLARLTFLLHDWAGRFNLTGHRSPAEIAVRLVLDAAALGQTLPELSTADTLVDLGSGAGFPGLPLAILHPQLMVVLVDSRMKRHHFQRAARRTLSLSNVEPRLGRAEALEPTPAAIAVAQAMTQPDQALALLHRWLRPGGIAVLPASDRADAPPRPTGFEPPTLRTYSVPGTDTTRKLWVARRRGD